LLDADAGVARVRGEKTTPHPRARRAASVKHDSLEIFDEARPLFFPRGCEDERQRPEIGFGFSEAKCFELGGFALGILADEDEVTIVVTSTCRLLAQYLETCSPSAVSHASLLVGLISMAPRAGSWPG